MYKRTMRLLGEDLAKTGCLHEYYNPFNGEPVMNGGFINWNILCLLYTSRIEVTAAGKPGDVIELHCFEVLDKDVYKRQVYSCGV